MKQVEFAKEETDELKNAFDLNKRIFDGVQEEYNSMQAKLNDMTPKYQMSMDLKKKNAELNKIMNENFEVIEKLTS